MIFNEDEKKFENTSDLNYILRKKMINTMQKSLRNIRLILGLGVQELGELIGLTRQTINNLETKKNNMNSIQYIAICSIIENYAKEKPELLSIISTILRANEVDYENNIFDISINSSFLRKWFLCFQTKTKILKNLGFELKNEKKFLNNKLSKEYKIFIDSSAILKKNFIDSLYSLLILMIENNNKFIISLKTIEYIQYKLVNCSPEEEEKYKNTIKLLSEMKSRSLIEIHGEETDINEEITLISVFTKFKVIYKLALITDSLKLAKQISLINNDIVEDNKILLLQISDDNQVLEYDREDN